MGLAFHAFYQIDTMRAVICMGLCELRLFDHVLHGFHRVVDVSLCCMCFIVLLIFECVLHGLYRFVSS